jgi:elongation factor 1-gamma
LSIAFEIAKKYADMSSRNVAGNKQVSQSCDKKADDDKDKKKAQEAKAPKKAKENDNVDDDAAAGGDETDDVYASEPKQKDPFSEMPKTTLNMDEFKRVYSNEDTAEKAIPYFWKNFDNENCSIWFCEYKFPEDLKQVFMTCNLVSGFYQRLEKLRKHAFASMCVFGENNDNTIAGIWFWRGQGLAFEVRRNVSLSIFLTYRACSVFLSSFHRIGKSIMNRTHGSDCPSMMKKQRK